ncbi:hypothetical protein [Haliscomenobacter sp.]|uniref:hypothetical protein n=1 Tax=Haliscomenobacter sp. TaxID=2717303 RepID=UPI003364C9B1
MNIQKKLGEALASPEEVKFTVFYRVKKIHNKNKGVIHEIKGNDLEVQLTA